MIKQKSQVTFAIAFVIVFAAEIAAQAPDTLWTRVYGDYLAYEGNSISPSFDGGFIVAGVGLDSVFSNGALLMKVDSVGNVIWSDCAGAPNGAAYNCAVQAAEGTILAGGWWHGIMGGRRSGAIAFSNNGMPIWGVNLYSDGFQANGVTWIDRTIDGGYIIIDDPTDWQYRDNMRITKVDSLGETIWSRIYGDTLDELSGAVRPDTNGGYIIAGSTASFGDGNLDGYLIRINDIGDTIWTRTYGGSGNEWFFEIVHAADSGYVMVGLTRSFGNGGSDIYIVRTNSVGDTMWTRTFGTEADDFGSSIDKISSGGYIVGGTSAGHAYLLRLNDDGDTLWTGTFFQSEPNSSANSVIAMPDGGFAFTGQILSGGQFPWGLWIVRLGPEVVSVDEPAPDLPNDFSLSQNYPNPFNEQTVIGVEIGAQLTDASLTICNLVGQLIATIFEGEISAGSHRFIWNGRDEEGNDVTSGLYFYQFRAGERTINRRMIFIK
jgi:hypothetical protein